MRERWASFSVSDHNATEKLVTDVLTYDRLVFPFPPDETEKNRWRSCGWNPELLDKRLEQLGDRAIKVPWDQYRREKYSERMQRLSALAKDAGTLIPTNAAYQMTRLILAQGEELKLPRGVTGVTAVVGYHSLADLRTEYLLDGERSDPNLLSVLVRNRIAQPIFSDDPERSLVLAIALSRDPAFQEKRRALYQWQETVIKDKMPPGRAMEELEDLVERYNSLVKSANQKIAYRLVFTVIACGLTITSALLASPIASVPFAIAGASTAVQLARFATLERSPVVRVSEADPAAMFHQIENL